MAPKSYAYEIFDKSDPFAKKPVSTVVKMKGIFINAKMKEALTVDLLKKLTFDELSLAEGSEFFEKLSSACPDNYGKKSNESWVKDREFTLPQPNLRKNLHTFGIEERADMTKKLSARFDKRVLNIPYVSQDLSSLDLAQTDPDSLSPSFPFGYRCAFLDNL